MCQEFSSSQYCTDELNIHQRTLKRNLSAWNILTMFYALRYFSKTFGRVTCPPRNICEALNTIKHSPRVCPSSCRFGCHSYWIPTFASGVVKERKCGLFTSCIHTFEHTHTHAHTLMIQTACVWGNRTHFAVEHLIPCYMVQFHTVKVISETDTHTHARYSSETKHRSFSSQNRNGKPFISAKGKMVEKHESFEQLRYHYITIHSEKISYDTRRHFLDTCYGHHNI